MNERTLVILSPGFAKDESDTTCLPERQSFIKALKKSDPSLNIILLAFQYPFCRKTYKWYGVSVISFNGKNKGQFNRVSLWISVWRILKKLEKENNIVCILNFWLGECALVGKFFGKRYNIRQFTWLLGQDAKKGNKYARLVKPTAGELIALSDFTAEEFSRNYNTRPKHIIPVGIDTTLFPEEIFPRTIDVLGAGSLISLKQFDVFIDIIRSLKKIFPDITAVICGEGPEKESLLTQIQQPGLEKNIILTGEIPHRELLALMQQSKVFLHTSSYEGFGAVCAEALYAGAHVVSFCKPMQQDIPHWHHAGTTAEMLDLVKNILHDPGIDHTSILAYSIDDVAMSVKNLFSGQLPA